MVRDERRGVKEGGRERRRRRKREVQREHSQFLASRIISCLFVFTNLLFSAALEECALLIP